MSWSNLPDTVLDELVNCNAGVGPRLQTVCRSWRDRAKKISLRRVVFPDFQISPAEAPVDDKWCYHYKRHPHRSSIPLETVFRFLDLCDDKSKVVDVRLLIMTFTEASRYRNQICPLVCLALSRFDNLQHLALRTMIWTEAAGLTDYSGVRFLPPSLKHLEIDIHLRHDTRFHNTLEWFNALRGLEALRIYMTTDARWDDTAEMLFEFIIGDLCLPLLGELSLHVDDNNPADVVASHLTLQRIPAECLVDCVKVGLLSAGDRNSLSCIYEDCVRFNLQPPSELRIVP